MKQYLQSEAERNSDRPLQQINSLVGSIFHTAGRSSNALMLSSVMLITLSACTTLEDMLELEEVKPWQRGALARDDMQLSTDAMHQSVDDHIYFSKEASTGGANVQGGGCGCN